MKLHPARPTTGRTGHDKTSPIMPSFLRFPFSIPLKTLSPTKQNARRCPPWPSSLLTQTSSISSLKVAWRKDRLLDSAIERDKLWRLCARIVREVLNELGRVIPLRYLEKRRECLRLPIKVKTFLSHYPNLFDLYPDRIKPKSEPVPFLRPSPRLCSFLDLEASIRARDEPLVLAKLYKLLMMSKDKVISAEKLLNVKRDFGFPKDPNDKISYGSYRTGTRAMPCLICLGHVSPSPNEPCQA